ncbi:hypothetical protein BHE74_00019674, partial [Ensete ventricosum]
SKCGSHARVIVDHRITKRLPMIDGAPRSNASEGHRTPSVDVRRSVNRYAFDGVG